MPAWHGWLLLGVSLFVAVALNVSFFLPVDRSVFKIIVVFLIPLATLLYVARGNLGTVIKKPRLGDIPLIIVELNDGELKGVAGGIEVPPPLVPPAPIGEGHLGEQQTNCPLFSTRNT